MIYHSTSANVCPSCIHPRHRRPLIAAQRLFRHRLSIVWSRYENWKNFRSNSTHEHRTSSSRYYPDIQWVHFGCSSCSSRMQSVWMSSKHVQKVKRKSVWEFWRGQKRWSSYHWVRIRQIHCTRFVFWKNWNKVRIRCIAFRLHASRKSSTKARGYRHRHKSGFCQQSSCSICYLLLSAFRLRSGHSECGPVYFADADESWSCETKNVAIRPLWLCRRNGTAIGESWKIQWTKSIDSRFRIGVQGTQKTIMWNPN